MALTDVLLPHGHPLRLVAAPSAGRGRGLHPAEATARLGGAARNHGEIMRS